ncbi:hotdog fold thioesterase [Mannheimia pernigra]|uniref:hotdog fold thioesterase n=1 Tax=Mannheimia pernigra TaxID=111844 RepID=UPI002352105C|nr:hotdog fold thioesterase [Mannheimia pernigra]
MTAIWNSQMTKDLSPEQIIDKLNHFCSQSAVAHLGIKFSKITDDTLEATLPLDHRTQQPFGLLHGGVSAALAETLGSAGSSLMCNADQIAVGTELSISHLKSVKKGMVTGVTKPLHLGGSSQVWQIELFDEEGNLCAISRLTNRILEKR